MLDANDWLKLIDSEVVKALFGLFALVVGARFAIHAFYRQKEYELVKQRYLDGGVDIIAAAFEQLSGAVSHNYARALMLLKFLREEGGDFDAAELDSGYREFDSSSFHEVAFFRLRILLGSSIYWDLFQSAKAGCEAVNNIMVSEVRHGIRLALKNPAKINNDFQTFAREFSEHCRDKFDGLMIEHAGALHELNVIATVLSSQKRLSFDQVERFRKIPEVVDSMRRVRIKYPEAAAEETN